MAGVTKHIYNREIIDIKKMWNEQLKHIANVLEKNYEDTDIVDTLKHYYPYEWESVEIKREYYQKKDKFIKKRYGKARYILYLLNLIIPKIQFGVNMNLIIFYH